MTGVHLLQPRPTTSVGSSQSIPSAPELLGHGQIHDVNARLSPTRWLAAPGTVTGHMRVTLHSNLGPLGPLDFIEKVSTYLHL